MVCNKRNCRYLFQKIQNTAQVLKINETEINTENAFSWDRLGIGGDNKSDFGDDNEKWNFKPQSRHIWDALRDLVLFVQFKKREKYPWCIVTFSNKSNTPPWVFFIFLKLYNWYQIAQSATCVSKDNLLLAIF